MRLVSVISATFLTAEFFFSDDIQFFFVLSVLVGNYNCSISFRFLSVGALSCCSFRLLVEGSLRQLVSPS